MGVINRIFKTMYDGWSYHMDGQVGVKAFWSLLTPFLAVIDYGQDEPFLRKDGNPENERKTFTEWMNWPQVARFGYAGAHVVRYFVLSVAFLLLSDLRRVSGPFASPRSSSTPASSNVRCS